MLKRLSFLFLIFCSCATQAQSLPEGFTLDTLSAYVNQQPDCEQLSCSLITAMSVKSYSLNKKELVLNLQTSARTLSVLALPFSIDQVYIDEALLDNKTWLGLRAQKNQYEAILPEGSHTLTLRLRLKGNINSLTLAFAPPNFKNEDKASTINLIKNNDVFFLELAQTASQENNTQINDKSVQSIEKNNALPLETYYMVNRELLLQDKWKLKTTVSLLPGTDTSKAKSIQVKLLPGESVLTENITPVDSKIIIYPQNGIVSWDSILEKTPSLTLPASENYIQSWKIESEKDWFFNYKGLTPYEQTTKGYRWVFFPKDTLELKFEKPAVQAGRSLNVTDLNMSIVNDKATISFKMNSSLGGRTYVQLPQFVKVTKFIINENTIGVPQEEKNLAMDLKSGENNVNLELTTNQQGLKTTLPQLNFEQGIVNATYNFDNNDATRWIIGAGGADINPPIQMWGILLAIIFFSYFLSKTKVPLSMTSWSLLLFGFIQFDFIAALFIVLTLLFFSFKIQITQALDSANTYNWIQKLLIILSVLCALVILAVLFHALSGNYGVFVPKTLNWFNEQMPKQSHTPWFISVPIWVYRTLMFIWAGWLAWRLVALGKWGWNVYLTGGIKKEQSVVQIQQK